MPLSNKKIENALLATMLGDGASWEGVHISRVNLPSGHLQQEPGEWAYFPVDALISWVPTHAMPGAVALVGQRGCVLWPSAPSAHVQVHVVSPGHAYRLDWAAVRQDPSRFAPWLWHTTAAAQSLIAQMAQWSFCAQHHSPSQRLASWLLHGLAQSSKAELLLSEQSLPLGMQQWLRTSHAVSGAVSDAVSEAVDAQANHDPGYILKDGCLRTTDTAQLLAQACACHTSLCSLDAAPH